jgi:DNA-binding transcriptional regulator YdaS (Cro superfamily)
MDTKAITKAVDLLDGTNATAEKLQVSPPTVSEWLSGKRPVPWKRCIELERLTGGEVKRKELLPDFDWDFLAKQSKAAA